MKDIDFDELDRAVNSLMSGVPKSAPVKNDDVKVLTLDAKLTEPVAPQSPSQPVTAPAELVQPTDVTDAPAPTAAEESAASSVSSVAARRAGRFMDVVHPSSDMTKATPPARGVSRQGVTIEPRPAVPAPSVGQPVVAPEPVSAPTAAAEPASVVAPKEEAPSTNDWPDPLDMPTGESEPASAPEPLESAVQEVAAEPAPSANEPSEPLVSPFLADAKVEKRPLGGAAPAQADTKADKAEEPDHSPVLGVMAADSPSDDDTDSQLPPEPVETQAPLPEELRGDLMAIESDTSPVVESPEAEPASAPAAETPRPAAPAQPTPTGPSSIQQQYKEEPSTGDQTSGAIFDAAAYHQPLTHPAKKKSSWPWIVGVIVILLLGAAGGAALYFLNIV